MTTALVPPQCSKILSTEKARRARRTRRPPASPAVRGSTQAPCSPCPPRFLRAESLRFSRTAQSARPVRRDRADRVMTGPQLRTRAPVWRRPICWMSRSWPDSGLFLRDCKTIGGDWLPAVENCGKSSLGPHLRGDEARVPSPSMAGSAANAQRSTLQVYLPDTAGAVSRSTSSGCNVPSRSKCQKVQPLQDGAFCTSAPTLWIEPR